MIFDEKNNLKLIDPRPIFGKSSLIGDLYYELAKIDHALLVNGKSIRSNEYSFKINSFNEAQIWIKELKEFEMFRKRIYEFCREKNWSTTNLSLATSLTILSICTVHTKTNTIINFSYLLVNFF